MAGLKANVLALLPIAAIFFITSCATLRDLNDKGVVDREGHIAIDNRSYKIPDLKTPVLLDENHGWIRNYKNVLSGFYSLYQPEVVYVKGDEYPYKMWFMGWAHTFLNKPDTLADGSYYPGHNGVNGGDAIFFARAKTLDEWQVYSRKRNGTGEVYWDENQQTADWVPVLTSQGDTWFDDLHVGDPSVIYMNGTFYMAYSAMGTDKKNPSEPYPWSDNAACIMGATSKDGIHWTRSKEPLMIWGKEYGFNEMNQKAFYYGGYQRPALLLEDGKWRMWFDHEAGSKNKISIGYAENAGDFLNSRSWKRISGDTTPVLTQFVDVDVVKIGSIYYAYGDPFVEWHHVKDKAITDSDNGWSGRQIVEAQSYDGINWKITGYFKPDPGYPANQIPQVFLDHENKRVCIFYATQRGKRQSKEYDWKWDNFRYMYKELKAYEDSK
ncbi:hypothetical protein MMC2321_01475 [Chitinophaga sp. MM2321]